MSLIPVRLKLRGIQTYDGEQPDVIELDTEGTMERIKENVWQICYEESALTGLEGVTTEFRVGARGVILNRTGRLQSRMIFREGKRHESLYQMEMGALLIAVEAKEVRHQLSEAGGTVDIVYSIEIEQAAEGRVEYHLDVAPLR